MTPPRTTDELLRDLLDTAGALETVAARHGMTLAELAERLGSSHAELEGLCLLFERVARLRLSRCRADAARRLAQLIADDDGDQQARRACLDVLKAAPAAPLPAPATETAAIDAAGLLAALERIGREAAR